MKKKALLILFGVAVVVGSLRLGRYISASPDTGLTLLVGLAPVLICLWILFKDKTDQRFLLRVFVLALVLRWVVAFIIYSQDLQSFFGGDAGTFDFIGIRLSDFWKGRISYNPWMDEYSGMTRPGWGMYYYVAIAYYVVGRSQLVVQLINCALGAASCIAVYRLAETIYPERRVARTAAILTALSPSMILWSSQMMKDGPIVLTLSLCALYTAKLQQQLKVKDALLLLVSLFCLFSLRNYAFYIMFTGVVLSLLLTGKRFTPLRFIQGGVLVLVISGALAYLGAGSVARNSFDLKTIQAARSWSAGVANSGYGADVDITDPAAALAFLPIGLAYMLFAPFPWMVTNLRQFITLPELIAWWLLVPMMVKGFWYSVRHRLKESVSIVIFTVGLTLVYALYQSNVGTAYRHRAQLYVFFFIFISIGLELRRKARLQKRSQVPFSPPFGPAPQSAPGVLARGTINPRLS